MNKIDLTPGCYSVPLGSDLLQWLAHHCADLQRLNAMVVLPTQRAVNRFKGLLYRLNPVLVAEANVITYKDLAEGGMSLVASQCILWEFATHVSVTAELFQNKAPSSAQRQQIAIALNDMLSELYAHEVDSNILNRAFERGLAVRHLIEIFQNYESILKEAGLIHSMAALIKGIKSFSDRVELLNRPVYLVVDGAVSPALQQLAVKLSKNHYVFIYGDLPKIECAGYDPKNCYASLYKTLQYQGINIQSLELYTHRKILIDELQKPIFDATEIAPSFKEIQLIERSNDIFLAQDIIAIAKKVFFNNIKSISVVTPSQALARVIHLAAQEANISVDDSNGILLNETVFGSLLIQVLRCLMNPSYYRAILNMISHPRLSKFWGELPAKLDALGRFEGISFIQTLRNYIPENEQENERLLSLVHFIQETPFVEFSKQLNQALHYLNLWGIHPEDYPESKEILEISESMKTCEILEFVLSSTPYRTPTPKGSHIQIMGPLEARLMQPEVVVLADLNEGDWPMPASSNPFLYANLRKELDLLKVDQISGVSSKILLSLLACKTVYMCRTTHQNGQPIQSSRWWERLKVISKLNNVQLPHHTAENKISVQRLFNLNSFRIPRELIPKRISISDIQLMINDPQLFILRNILKLEELPMWEVESDFRYKGIIVHETLEMGIKQDLPVEVMINIALNKLENLNLEEHDRMFWETQIITNIRSFNVLNQTAHAAKTYVEIKGEWTLTTRFGAITIVGKADRIDQMPDGSLQIIDYKTGSLPTKQSVYKGQFPQLPLLGLMLLKGAFQELPEKAPFMMSYWDLKEGTSMNFLFDELVHLELHFIEAIEKLLDPSTLFDLTFSSKG